MSKDVDGKYFIIASLRTPMLQVSLRNLEL